MRFNIDEYQDYGSQSFAMRCRTSQEIDKFSEYLDSVGREWRSGARYTEWLPEWPDIIFCFNSGTYAKEYRNLHRDYYVLEFSDFDWDDYPGDEIEFSISFDDIFDGME